MLGPTPTVFQRIMVISCLMLLSSFGIILCISSHYVSIVVCFSFHRNYYVSLLVIFLLLFPFDYFWYLCELRTTVIFSSVIQEALSNVDAIDKNF